MKKMLCLILSVLLLLALTMPAGAQEEAVVTEKTSAEGGSESGTPAPTPTQAPKPTEESKPTETPKPTEESKPTEEPKPTEAPKPTEEPKPTEAPKPTEESKPTEAPAQCSHSWDDGRVETAATCAREGTYVWKCKNCGETKSERIPKLTTHTVDNDCDPDCNVCGLKRKVQHQYSNAWSKNAKGHWHECSVCGDMKDAEVHYPGPAATEEKAQICLTCGYTLMPRLNHVHKYEEKWRSDETGHWYACEGCEERKDFASHVYDDGCDTQCNDCGYPNPNAHTYGTEIFHDETGHWGICSVCKEKSAVYAHTPGPVASDTQPQLCQECGYEMAPAQKHVHEYGMQWQHDTSGHWQQCQCGETSEVQPHNWTVAKRESETVRYVCKQCQQERTETIQKEAAFPWWMLFLGFSGLCLLAAIVVVIFIINAQKKHTGKFSR